MSLSETDRHEVWADPSFLFPVVHCLVAEENPDSLWHWIDLHEELGPKNLDRSTSPAWKQGTLRYMVEAQVYWSDSRDYIADAIAIVDKAWNMTTPTTRIPTRAALKFVCNVTKKHPTQNAELHDRLVDMMQKKFSREDENNWIMASLCLFHPTRPDTSRFMQILESDGAHLRSWFRPTNHNGGLDVLFTMCALAQRCLAEGRKSDATWELDYAYDRVPQLFSGGAALKSFRAKTSAAAPTAVTWPPSKAELEKGIQLDKEGNIIFSEKARKALNFPAESGPLSSDPRAHSCVGYL